MKKNLEFKKKIFLLMKISLFQFLILIVFSGVTLGREVYGQEVLNQKISMAIEEQGMRTVLTKIEQLANVKFTYQKKLFASDVRKSYSFSNEPLHVILTRIFFPLNISYKAIGNQIILGRPTSVLETQDPDLLPLFTAPGIIDKTVAGKVTDNKGAILPGVNIAVKGTTQGTTADANGRYSLAVPDNATLVFSFVGMQSQDVLVGTKTVIDIALEPDLNMLQEVQIVAFGEQRKQDVTGSISSLKAADIRANTAASPDVALQGRAAGVQITQAGGTPGGAVRINVRGIASISSNSQPLIVIDGQPVINSAFGAGGVAMNPLAEINPDDIASMEVLKDASASILFGSRAANGVILITTKRGAKGKPKFDFSYQQGINTATNSVAFVNNGADYFNILKRAASNNVAAGLAPQSTNLNTLLPVGILKGSLGASLDNILVDSTTLYNTSTNWLDQTLRTGRFSQATLGMRAGTNKLSFYVSGAYRQEDGIVIGQGLRRLSGRANVEYTPVRSLKLGANLSVNGVTNEMIPLANSYQYGLSSALPGYPVQLADGSYFNGIANGTNNTKSIGTNPVFYRNNYRNETNTFRSINNLFAQFEVIKGLNLRAEYGFDYQRSKNNILLNPTLYPVGIQGAEKSGGGRAEDRDVKNRNFNWNNTVNYTRGIGKSHRITALLGNSVQSRISDNETYITEGVPEGAKVGRDTARTVVYNDEKSFRFVSFFGRINYAFQDKYLFEASLRTDGSSRFGPGNRWASFPGASAGWVLSEEPFLKESRYINFLKIRSSYGLTGNAEIGNFSWQKTFTYVGYNAAIYGGNQGGQFTNPGNRSLTWESTSQFDLGLEFRVVSNRISGTVDYYDKVSDGLLLDYALGPLFGTINNAMTINLGSVRNRGIEFSLSTRNIQKRGFGWTTDFNISRNKNTVLSTYEASFLNYPFQVINGPNIATPGAPLGNYYMAEFAGFDPVTGNELFYERDRIAYANSGKTVRTGNLWDGTIANNSGNNQFILKDKTPYPTVFGGITNAFQVKQFDFSFLVYYQFGNWIYDQGERVQSYATTSQVLRADIPGIGDVRQELGRTEGPYRLQWNSNARSIESTRFLHNGSFARLKNVQAGYNVPSAVAKKLHLQSGRVYVTGQNLLTATRFKGWDPEVFRNGGADGSTATLSPGVTNNDLPQVRTILLGINLGF